MVIAAGHPRGGRGGADLAHGRVPGGAADAGEARAARRNRGRKAATAQARPRMTPARRSPLERRAISPRQARLWAQKWRWYERNSLPWNRARIHWESMRREAFVRWPVHGNVLEALREGRLELGAGVLLEPGVWITAPGRRAGAHRRGHVPEHGRDGRRPGAGRDRRSLHARQRLLRHRREPPLRRSEQPIPWQGFTTKGPTRIGDNCWLGANVVVTSGVTHRRALRDRRQQRRDARHRAVLDRRGRAGEGAQEGRLRQPRESEPTSSEGSIE